jgi:O-antigen/teichoic acid export membrane protein
MTQFRSAIAWTLAGNTIYAGCQWAMLMVVAKLASAESVGAFALAFAITAPVMMLSNLQPRAVQATDARDKFAFGHHFALRIVTIAGALLVCLSVGWFRVSRPLVGVVVLIAAAKAVESMSDIMYGLMQRRQDMRSIAISMIAKGSLSVAVLGIVLYATASLPLACLGLAGSWAVILGLYDLRVVRGLLESSHTAMRPIWNWPALLSLAALALPLGLVMGVLSVHANVPRYFIGFSLGVAEVGAFSAMASLGIVGATVCSALGQVASPGLANDYAAGNQRPFLLTVAKLLIAALAAGIMGIVAAATWGSWLLTTLFRAEYGRLQEVFVLLMFSAGLSYLASVLGYALTAARRFYCQLPIFAIALAVSAAVCAWLTPRIGLRGAAIGAVAGSLTQTLGAGWALLSTAGVGIRARQRGVMTGPAPC